MAELVVKYRLDADGLLVKDLIAERDFLAQWLGIPEHLLQVLSWGQSSVLITYWMVRDLLPLVELALCREDVRAELTRHGVEVIYLGSHLQSILARYAPRGMVLVLWSIHFMATLPSSLQVDHFQHCKEDCSSVHSFVL